MEEINGKKIEIKTLTPMFNMILTSACRYTEDEVKTAGGLIDLSKEDQPVKEFQEILAVGPNVKDLKVGDFVCLNFNRYKRPIHNDQDAANKIKGDKITFEYLFDSVVVDNVQMLRLYDSDVVYKINSYKEVKQILIPDKKIIK